MRLAVPGLALAASVLSIPAFAQEQTPAAPEQEERAEKKKVKKEKKICRSVSEMGSRRSKRMCLTADEWTDFNQGN